MASGHDRSLSTLEKERPDALLVLGHPLILFRRGQRLRGFHAPAVSANCDSGHDHITLVAALSFGERPCDFCQQAIELERLGVTVIATRGQRLLAIAHMACAGR